MTVDKRGKLLDDVFSYEAHKDGKVFIYWHTRQVTILKGKAAQKFLANIEKLQPHQAQLLMAKATGNFKRGNER